MNILLTGGAGYIGSHAALSLLDDGHKVHIIDNLSTGNEMLIPRSAKFTNCNINNEEVISNLIQSNNFDLLMHFAGFIQVEESVNQPEKYFRAAITLGLNMDHDLAMAKLNLAGILFTKRRRRVSCSI